MIGAIIGDIVGSPYEGYTNQRQVKNKNFPFFRKESRFTDDSVLTCATAHAIIANTLTEANELNNNTELWEHISVMPQFSAFYKYWGKRYPNRGYGSGFREWLAVENSEINFVKDSFANGCMMRCSPIGLYASSLDQARKLALESIKMTHNSPESERGVQSIVSAIYMAKTGCSKIDIKKYVEVQFGHMLDLTVEEWRNKNKPTIRCNVTGPQALVCFMESTDYKSAIKNAVYTKGDTDTIAAIAGSIAEAFYGIDSIPRHLIDKSKALLTPEMIDIIRSFYKILGNTLSQYKNFEL